MRSEKNVYCRSFAREHMYYNKQCPQQHPYDNKAAGFTGLFPGKSLSV